MVKLRPPPGAGASGAGGRRGAPQAAADGQARGRAPAGGGLGGGARGGRGLRGGPAGLGQRAGFARPVAGLRQRGVRPGVARRVADDAHQDPQPPLHGSGLRPGRAPPPHRRQAQARGGGRRRAGPHRLPPPAHRRGPPGEGEGGGAAAVSAAAEAAAASSAGGSTASAAGRLESSLSLESNPSLESSPSLRTAPSSHSRRPRAAAPATCADSLGLATLGAPGPAPLPPRLCRRAFAAARRCTSGPQSWCRSGGTRTSPRGRRTRSS